MNSRKLLQPTIGLTLVVLLLVGCSGASIGPTAMPTPATLTATLIPIPTKTLTPYATPISVSQSDISKIAIEYSWEGWGSRKYSGVIEKVNSGFRTDQGENVDGSQVIGLGNSLINLRRSGGMKSCIDHTDDYPVFRVEIAYENGNKAILYSNSNCPQNIPWNVVYNSNLYVQYNGEIPTALYSLLSALDSGSEEWSLVDDWSSWGGFEFSIISNELPKEIEETTFSERELYLQILIESDLFGPFVSEYKVSDLGLFCSLDAGNRDCSEIDGMVTLDSTDGEIVYSMPVKYKNQEVSEVGSSMGQMKGISERVYEHALVRRVKALKPETAVMISCSQQSHCDEADYYNRVYSSLGLSTPSECSLCSIRFDKWDVYHEFIYLPEIERIWVNYLHYSPGKFQENKSVLDLDHLFEFYRSPGYETFVDEHITDFEIQTCHRVMVYYEQGVLEENPDYISILNDENAQNYGNRIDVYDYCVFVNAEGGLEAKKWAQYQ